jgi:Kef-type K+ transport system membrane component KefB
VGFVQSLLPNPANAHHFDFLWQICLVIVAVKAAGHLSRKLGQPSVFGKLIVGLVLGPAALGWISPVPLLNELAEIGVILLMFLAGLETDVAQFRQGALGSTWVAIGGVVLPFLFGWGAATLYGHTGATALFIGVLLVATSVSISVQTLRELHRLRSREGVTILGAAVIDDVLGIIVLSVVLGLAAPGAGGAGAAGIAALLLKMFIFFGAASLVGMYILPFLFKFFGKMEVTATRLALGICVALGFAYAAELFGIAGIVGAYLAGLMIAVTPATDKQMVHDLEQTAFAFVVPFFFVSVGLRADLSDFSLSTIEFITVLTVLAVLSKLVGCGAGALLARFNLRSSLGIGCGMVARGEVGLIVAAIGLDRGLIGNELFTAMVVLVLVTTLITPPLLKLTFRPSPATDHQQGATTSHV